ncbi:MAG: restriction endonuclease subunit S [Desulfobacteraceae bacterium]|nr:restriction endonuclease subunit S [Desulfobacteraceae bacterium]
MDLNMLFENYNLLMDSPNSTAKMREMVLQLAVQGKLVEQDPNDEPASELLKRIKAEKEKLIAEGTIKKQKPLPPITEDEIPYELPRGWAWVKLGELAANIHYGFTASANNFVHDVRLLRITDIQNNKVNWNTVPGCDISDTEIGKYELRDNDILIARTGGTIGKSFIVKDIHVKAVFASYLIRVIPCEILDADYIKLSLESPMYWIQLFEKSMGTGQPNVNASSLKQLKITLPPLAEQKRIVSKVDQLMQLCDQLDACQKKAATKYESLNSSALEKLLSAKSINEFANHRQFLCNNFDLIYNDPAHVNKLRQAILRLAVQGKLAPQDPNAEPAGELLKRIKAEKEKLIAEGKIRKQKPLQPFGEDEIPYELPQGWEWVRMKKITYNMGQKKPDKRFTYIDVTAIDKEKGTISNQVKVLEPSEAPSRARKIVQKETIIYSTVRPYLLNVAIVDKEFEPEPIVSTAFAILNPYKDIYNKYLYYFLRSKIMIDYVESKMIGMAYPAINDTQFLKAPFPLPPLEEQKRIVSKVDQLMHLCDELETQLNQSKKDSEMLMQAELHEAFS